MFEQFATAFKETKVQDIPKESSDVPNFAKNSKAETVSSFEDANKPIRHIDTHNQSLEGGVHPITGVSFERKTVELPGGDRVEGVFPVFESDFDAKLDESQYKESDARQFKSANEQLKNEVESNPDTGDKFTPEQLEQIKEGDTPDGYVWHHSEEPGVLQLVEKDKHDSTGHHGGRFVWGGGSEAR